MGNRSMGNRSMGNRSMGNRSMGNRSIIIRLLPSPSNSSRTTDDDFAGKREIKSLLP